MFTKLRSAFWEYGIGAMCWRHVRDRGGGPAVRALYVLLPPRGDAHMLYVDRLPDDWAAPGKTRGWDGNIKRPTLSPSIQTLPAETGWHGYLEDGNLRTC